MTLEQVVHRIATDSAFSAAFRTDPDATLREEGVQLDQGEVRAIFSALNQQKTQNAAIPWFESQLNRGKPQAAIPWFEAQLGVRPT